MTLCALAIIRLAKQYGRFRYRKITEVLRVEGWRATHKKRKRLSHKDSSIIRLRPVHPHHVWAIDFVYDKLSNDEQ